MNKAHETLKIAADNEHRILQSVAGFEKKGFPGANIGKDPSQVWSLLYNNCDLGFVHF